MLIIILNRNNVKEFSGKNKKKIDKLPANAPFTHERKGAFLFSKYETLKSNNKSNPKFTKKIRSKYNFIFSPILI